MSRTDAAGHGRRTARIVVGRGSDGFTAAAAPVIAREAASHRPETNKGARPGRASTRAGAVAAR
jgi:hypothetical protein